MDSTILQALFWGHLFIYVGFQKKRKDVVNFQADGGLRL